MSTVCVIQARMNSTRYPGKVMAKLNHYPVLDWVVRACENAVGVDQVVVATTTNKEDDVIEAYYKGRPTVKVIRGSEHDVLSRFVLAAEATRGEVFLRVTADEPLIDPVVISGVIRLQRQTGADYVSNIHPRTYPDGLDVECFTAHALMAADREAKRAVDRDTVTYWMVRNASRFPSATLVNPLPNMEKERWVLDTQADMKFCAAIAAQWPWVNGPPSMYDILDILDRNPDLRAINSHHIMNERFFEALGTEEPHKRSYGRSRSAYDRAVKTIPLGAQTFSKSRVQFPANNPLFLSHGQGAYAYDVDGNDYVDLMGALLPNILGYGDSSVDCAIRAQLNKGISFSLATELESDLAERLVRLIPCAEQVRFGKNGTDVTTAAVRLSRAATGRDHFLNSGYHGWSDIFVAGDGMRGTGCTFGVGKHTCRLAHGDSETAIRELKTEKYACVIVEPETNPEFLQVLRDLCDETGTLLIFDEVITWPRWGLSGAQGHFGISPDLTTIGKALSNGMPLSAICGSEKLMKLFEPPDNIFFSGTAFGETLSIAAAIATVDKLERENVVAHLHEQARIVGGQMLNCLSRHDIPANIEITHGLIRIGFDDRDTTTKEQLATLFRQEMAANGVLIINANALSFAHKEPEIQRVGAAYEAAFEEIARAVKQGDVGQRLGGQAIQASANVRSNGGDF